MPDVDRRQTTTDAGRQPVYYPVIGDGDDDNQGGTAGLARESDVLAGGGQASAQPGGSRHFTRYVFNLTYYTRSPRGRPAAAAPVQLCRSSLIKAKQLQTQTRRRPRCAHIPAPGLCHCQTTESHIRSPPPRTPSDECRCRSLGRRFPTWYEHQQLCYKNNYIYITFTRDGGIVQCAQPSMAQRNRTSSFCHRQRQRYTKNITRGLVQASAFCSRTNSCNAAP